MKDKSNAQAAFFYWLPFAAVIIIFAGLVYAAVQQNYRMSANDPQIQIAEDVAAAITDGKATPDAIVPAAPTAEIAPSLSAFVVMYSATGTPIGASAGINGKAPALPSGVLDSVKAHGEDRFTWQPQANTRIAAVVTSFAGPTPGFVLAGRSIREVEVREKNLEIMTGVAALIALGVTFLLVLLLVNMKMGSSGESQSEQNKGEVKETQSADANKPK